jgi:hypothetical protein
MSRSRRITRLWGDLGRQPNTNEWLQEKAEALASVLAAAHLGGTDRLLKETEKSSDKTFSEDSLLLVFFETATFYLHYVDRVVHHYLVPDKRKIFMDVLVVKFSEAMNETYANAMERGDLATPPCQLLSRLCRPFFSSKGELLIPFDELYNELFNLTSAPGNEDLTAFDELYNERQSRYHKLPFATEDESLQGTLFWEFAKNLSQRIGCGRDPVVIACILAHTSASTAAMALPELLGE